MIRLLLGLLLTGTTLAGSFDCPFKSAPAQGDLGSTRLEIPFQFNKQALALLVDITYQLSTHKILATSSMVRGNTNMIWTNIFRPTADYTGEELTVFVGMKYTAPTNDNTYMAGQSGVGDVNGTRVTITLLGDAPKPQSAYISGILHARFDVDGQKGTGRGTIQVNDLSEPRHTYVIKPR